MDNENIYYEKKKDRRFIILTILSFVFIAIVFYSLNFFNINPHNTLYIINKGNMSPAYSRDYIFSITDQSVTPSFSELQVVINETLNTDMSESLQHVSLNSGENIFDWDRFFKFDTAFIKTPYDTRYIKFENYNENYSHSYPTNKSNLTDMLLKYSIKNANIFFDSNNYEDKKIKVNFSGESFSEKVKLHYTLKFDESMSTDIFNDVYDSIWNSKEFLEFFKSDDDIQKKLGRENNTKSMIDLLYNIRTNSSIKDLTVGIVANSEMVETIIYDFDVIYNDGISDYNLKISFSEYLKNLDSSISPEDTFEALSVVDFSALTKHENNKVGDEVKTEATGTLTNANSTIDTEN